MAARCTPRPAPVGPARLELDLGAETIVTFTYKPATYRDGPMLMVFHGIRGNAAEYRDHARALADRHGLLVVAPRFGPARWGREKYQNGGLLVDGRVAPREEWTWSVVPRLADRMRRLERRPEMPYFLMGHSAGAQFLVRLAAFLPTDATRIVAANPSSQLFPTRDLPYPYGFGALPEGLVHEDLLRSYLQRPLTLYLGTGDDVRDDDLDTRADAERQGAHRLERGRNAFRAALSLAERRGWDLGWRLVEASGVAHDHEAVFDSPACGEALFGPEGSTSLTAGG
jgi:dienelactone hydrolase